MRIRTLIIAVVCLCMIGGLVAGLFSHSIQAALTVQNANAAHQANGAAPQPTVTRGGVNGTGNGNGQPVKTTTPAPVKSPTNVANGANVLAQDTFQRMAQTFWGSASDGRLWAGDANSIEVFSIATGAGQIDHAQGAFNAMLGPQITNVEVLVTVNVNHFAAGGTVNVGAALRWKDGNNWYKALIDGTKLQILSRVNGVTTSLASMPFAAKDGTTYNLRFRALGANLFARAWQSGQPEPATWMLTVANTALTQGLGGVRVLVLNTTVIRVTAFLETSVAPVE
ncbi:MAG TPA: hypothetical protein VFQ36_02695 [Ktedonobacteraceae bacterium]|nr:hypothetical protein [Ktedonobacteraceae bacterium]